MAGKDTNTGAKRARECREALGLAPDAPVDCVLSLVEERLGVPVVVARLPEGIAGVCWRDGDRTLLWVNGTHAHVRQRFTLAHELGHLRCGHDEAVPAETFETLGGKTTDSREVQANAFAAELLAPRAAVEAMAGDEPTLEDVVRIAARHGISTIAALFRLNSLGLTSRYEQLKAEVAQDDVVTAAWERLGPDPFEDAVSTIRPDALPRLSPALEGTALAALVRRRSGVHDAALAAGVDPAALARGAESIGV